jgi:hypothetical protein
MAGACRAMIMTPRRMTVKLGVLCLLLLPACSFLLPSSDPVIREYAVTWTCLSAEGCERTEEVSGIDRLIVTNYYEFHFASTQDEAFGLDAQRIDSDSLPERCYWLSFSPLFGHELEWAKTCSTAGGVDIELAIPNEDPATSSLWFVKARLLSLQ